MCLAFNTTAGHKAAVISVMLFCCFTANAQNITSPYSILGIGDIATKDNGRYFGMGSTSIALQSPDYFNFANPASLAALRYKVVNYSLNFRGKTNTVLSQSGTSNVSRASTKDFVVNRLGMFFKPALRWGFSVGLQPYSTVSYLVEETSSLFNGSGNFFKSIDGSGGLYQGYFSTGYQLSSHFSAGLTVSYLFGGLTRNTRYVSDELLLSIERNEYETLRSFQFKGGVQYVGKLSPGLSHRFGLTITNPATLQGQLISEYKEDQATLKKEVSEGNRFTLPLQLGAGYAVVFNESTTLAADYTYSSWKKQKLDYVNSYTGPAQRISIGLEYAPKMLMGTETADRFFLQAGVAYESSYMRIQKKSLEDISVSFGAGGSISRQLNVVAGIEAGRKGSLDKGQIKENYVQFNIGLVLRDIWIGSRFRRYD